jgi:hypothetical protein
VVHRAVHELRRAKEGAGVSPDAPGPLLMVGAWHLVAHQASCQALYNPRLMKGCGQTFGDNPEHLWAALRKYGASLAYMGDATRLDRLSLQVECSVAVLARTISMAVVVTFLQSMCNDLMPQPILIRTA